MIRKQSNDLTFLRFKRLSDVTGLWHGVTTRRGGVSRPPYAELNLGLHVGDDPDLVIENRRRLCAALGLKFEMLTLGAQVHGAELALVGEEQIGAGRVRVEEAIPGVDGLVVASPGVLAAVLSADCVPLILYDTKRHFGTVVHAGWRGTAAGIAAEAVRFLQEQCSTQPAHLLVGVAPSIGPCCYQVSLGVATEIASSFPYRAPIATERNGAWYVDLPEANRQQLLQSGIPPEQIELSGLCTSCHSDEFFSERKLGRPTGRFATFLCLR